MRGLALSNYSPGELEIIDAWAEGTDPVDTIGILLYDLYSGNVNLLDMFEGTIDEEWMEKLAKVIETIASLEGAAFIEDEDGDQDEDE